MTQPGGREPEPVRLMDIVEDVLGAWAVTFRRSMIDLGRAFGPIQGWTAMRDNAIRWS